MVSRRRTIRRLIGAGALCACCAFPARADYFKNCTEESEPYLALSVCSQVITAKEHSDYSLAAIHYRRGNIYFELRSFREAVRDYDSAITLLEQEGAAEYLISDLHFNRGRAYGELGEYDRALRDFKSADRLMPERFDSIFWQGAMYEKLGKREEAIAAYKLALTKEDSDYRAHEALKRLGAVSEE